MNANGAPALLEVDDLRKTFVSRAGVVRPRRSVVEAVAGVSFEVARGETFGLVGESGCGKSTVARCLVRLLAPTSGAVRVDGVDLATLPQRQLRMLRRRLQIVFQDAAGSLDPRLTIERIMLEPLELHRIGSPPERRRRVAAVLERVGLDMAVAARRPHELSGGQRQRVGIARALTLDPDLLVLDEPVSALDVSIQAQVLNLLRQIQAELGLTYVFIIHDLAVAEHFCDRVAVMYLGHVVESGTRESLFRKPLHPYTVALLSAVPIPEPRRGASRPVLLRGEPERGESAHPSGCPFRARCPVGRERERCATDRPPLQQVAGDQHVACHYPGELAWSPLNERVAERID